MQKVKRFALNGNGRDFVVGDIHGMYDTFKRMLLEVNFDYSNDRMFSVGDLVDRGPKSMDCLSLIYENWFHVTMANHEDMMIKALLDNDANYLDSWLYNGGQWSNHEDTKLLKVLSQDFLDKSSFINVVETPTGRVNILHAELYLNADRNPVTDEDIDNWNFHDINEVMMVWGRTIWENRINFPKVYQGLSPTYVGHSPVDSPVQCLSHRFIDTGAVFAETKQLDKSMTMVDITNNVVYSLKCKTNIMETYSCSQVF